MKKILMTMVAAFAAVSMNAQVYVGGTLGLEMQNKLADKDGSETSGMTFQIKPEVGYWLDENMAVGIVLGFGTTNNGNFINPEDGKAFAPNKKLDKSATQFTIAPYFRYNVLKFDRVNVFCDGMIDYTLNQKDSDNKVTRFGIHVVPGVAVNLNDKLSFVTKLGNGLGWSSRKVTVGGNDGDAQSTFGLDLNSLAGLQFGLYYNF